MYIPLNNEYLQGIRAINLEDSGFIVIRDGSTVQNVRGHGIMLSEILFYPHDILNYTLREFKW